MSNEEFQALVLKKLDLLENSLDGVKTDLGEVKIDLGEVKKDLGDVKIKLDAVYAQTASLSEFRTDADREFRDIKKTLDFMLHKEIDNEREIYYLKRTSD